MTLDERVLAWAVRQPLLTREQMAAMCGAPEGDTHRAITRLHEAGWLLIPDPPAPGTGRDSLIAASGAGLRWLEQHPRCAARQLGSLPFWQLRLQTVADAILAGPVTRILNAAMAATALAIRRDGEGGIVSTAYRPPRARRAALSGEPRPPLPWGNMEGRWRAGTAEARFALFCDRPRLPNALRSELLRSWQGAEHTRDEDPLLLVLCPGAAEQERWLELHGRAMRRRPRIAFVLQRAIYRGYGLDDQILKPADSRNPASLRQLLSWREAPADEPACGADDGEGVGGLPELALPEDALRLLRDPPRSAPATRRRAGVLLHLREEELWVLLLLARQPWLSERDIARLAGTTRPVVGRSLQVLAELGAATPHKAPDGLQRWRLEDDGLSLAAAHAGAARHWQAFAGRTTDYRSGRGTSPLIPDAHAAGVSRAAGLIAAAVRRAGLQLEDWYSERWWKSEVSRMAPVPDGAFRLLTARDERIVGMLEYERLRGGPRWPLKIEPWVEWYGAERWRTLPDPLRAAAGTTPLLLIVYDAAGRGAPDLLSALQRAPSGLPMFAAPEQDLVGDGLRKPIWWLSGGGTGPVVAASGVP